MEHHQVKWGRPRDDIYGRYDHKIHDAANKIPTSHTQQPIVTGSSVIGIKFKDGVILAADNLGTCLLDSDKYQSAQLCCDDMIGWPGTACTGLYRVGSFYTSVVRASHLIIGSCFLLLGVPPQEQTKLH